MSNDLSTAATVLPRRHCLLASSTAAWISLLDHRLSVSWPRCLRTWSLADGIAKGVAAAGAAAAGQGQQQQGQQGISSRAGAAAARAEAAAAFSEHDNRRHAHWTSFGLDNDYINKQMLCLKYVCLLGPPTGWIQQTRFETGSPSLSWFCLARSNAAM